jgi:UDP-N-acetylmuramate--alanine ligase
MSGLAKLLVQAGHIVSGSDLKPSRSITALRALGVETWVGHQPERAADWDLVVASSAVPGRDPELVAAAEAGAEVWERPALLAAITAATPALGVTGTHGKTTTTAMMVAALRALGRDPSFMVGGVLADLNTNAHRGEEGLFVLEADEAFGTFVDLRLAGLIVTSIEADHLDHYGEVERLEETFRDVARRVEGPLVVSLDDPGSAALARDVADAVTYGSDPEADWVVGDVRHAVGEVGFDLAHGTDRLRVSVARQGEHNALNAAAVLALVGELGLDVSAASRGLASFAGVRRRFEVKARVGGVTVIDDYAHHPTEVAATIAAAALGGAGRIVAVFQPHRYSRTRELAAAFGPALASADRVVITDVYAAGEAPIPGVTGRVVADAATAAGAEVDYVAHRADVARSVVAEARPGDVLLLMGAGDITMVADEVAALLGSDG